MRWRVLAALRLTPDDAGALEANSAASSSSRTCRDGRLIRVVQRTAATTVAGACIVVELEGGSEALPSEGKGMDSSSS